MSNCCSIEMTPRKSPNSSPVEAVLTEGKKYRTAGSPPGCIGLHGVVDVVPRRSAKSMVGNAKSIVSSAKGYSFSAAWW